MNAHMTLRHLCCVPPDDGKVAHTTNPTEVGYQSDRRPTYAPWYPPVSKPRTTRSPHPDHNLASPAPEQRTARTLATRPEIPPANYRTSTADTPAYSRSDPSPHHPAHPTHPPPTLHRTHQPVHPLPATTLSEPDTNTNPNTTKNTTNTHTVAIKLPPPPPPPPPIGPHYSPTT